MKIGIDVGSTAIKAVFVKSDQIVWKKAVPTKPGQPELVKRIIEEGMEACSVVKTAIEKTCVTGYGRNLIAESDFTVDELSANSAGIHRLTGGKARTVINIGGQDVKIIKLSPAGKILDFRMNDKCAAGTGRFFEIAAKILDTPLGEFHTAGGQTHEPVGINSTCAVFAESEIVSLMAQGIHKNRIIMGINNSVARRIANLLGNGTLEEDVYIDGGPAMNNGLVECLEDELFCDIKVLEEPQFTVAFGTLFTAPSLNPH
jgi:predicted CoA-substrate-specific enzyme activase